MSLEALETATIMFTDIEGSTRLWEQNGAVMSRALTAHDALARAAVEGHRGTVIKMIGDGMYAVFTDAVDALRAAVAIQLALADSEATSGLTLKVRCGLNTGLIERRDGDVFGAPVNRAARIEAAAHGGQVLVSQALFDDVCKRLPEDYALRDLGAVRLRDLGAAESLYQVLHPQLRPAFPALRSLEATPNNLPQQVTSFIGRERELDEAKKLLGGARLLTLLGMGGHGKTRLSLQIAADSLDRFPDGVWFLDLAPIQDPALVPGVAAQVLNLHEEPGKPILQVVCGHVKSHKALFIIDNCEHLVSACANLANALLRSAPDVRIIATTRETLRIPGEQAYPVLPLAVPDREAGLQSLLRSDAVVLFAERARLLKPDFTVTARNAAAVSEVVSRLEGIPLALELAAARLRSMSIDDINLRLKDRFKLLTGGSRVALERQQTLRALVQWSYDLLQPDESRLLDRLSTFSGGFDLAAAEEVAGVDPLSPWDIVDLVTSLVEKSLVLIEHSEEESRYGMLETIREFSRERLQASGEFESTAGRHCEYFLTLAKTARDRLQGADQADWTRRLETELDNMRAAISLALAGHVDTVIAVKFVVALMRFWTLRGYSAEGRDIVRAALKLPAIEAPDVPRAFALYVGGVLATNQGDYIEAKAMLRECVEIRRRLDHPREVAAGLAMLAGIHLTEGDAAKAREDAEDALAIFRKLKEPIGEGIGLHHLGEICIHLNDLASAKSYLEQGLAIAKSLKHQELESDCERGLGDLALQAGELAAARARYARCEAICRGAQDKRGGAIAQWRLGKTEAAGGELASAKQHMKEALQAFRSFAMNAEMVDCLEDYGEVLRREGLIEAAASVHAATAAIRQASLLPRSPLEESAWRRRDEDLRRALGEGTYQDTWAAAQLATLDETVQRVLEPPKEPAVTA
ncbi:MAG TPA: adenylate/guanylate cyclase domain-containing protein [Casimicrobiaceae bacterium]|nr:adenylate/guanylate cyclase domain-containing protein [Casimicrobiaceae bacterium]